MELQQILPGPQALHRSGDNSLLLTVLSTGPAPSDRALSIAAIEENLSFQRAALLIRLLVNLKPANTGSELLMRLLQPFHAKIIPTGSEPRLPLQFDQPSAHPLDREQNLVRALLTRLLQNGDSRPQCLRLFEMIGDKTAVSVNTAAQAAAKPTAAPAANSVLGQRFETGQIVTARVLEHNQTGQLRLQLANQTLLAKLNPSIRLQPGDGISLQLLKLDKTPQLQVLSINSQSSPQGLLLRQLLPREGDLQSLFRQIEGLRTSSPPPAQTSVTGQSFQSPPLTQLMELLSNQTLSPEKLNPQAVRSLFLASGLFLEANLARNRSEPADLKAALLRLVTLLRSGADLQASTPLLGALYKRLTQRSSNQPSPLPDRQQQLLNQLRSAAEGALAKVEIRQLGSLQQSEEGRQAWHLALPLLEEQTCRDLEIRIEREANRQSGEEGDAWTVNLHFDFDSSGPMDVRINLKGESVKVVFWSERQETLERIGKLLPKLEQSLLKAGLQVSQLSAYPGSAPQENGSQRQPNGPILNVTA